MCEITKNNFEEKYPEIIDDLQSASFIAIDCEFSGLFDSDNQCRNVPETHQTIVSSIRTINQHPLLNASHNFHVAGKGLYKILVNTLNDSKVCLFDSPTTRFAKVQNSLQNYVIVQMGISTFKYERTSNTFAAASYTFYLKPSSIVKNKFSFQIKSIEFLCKNKFDFNKLFYDGIDYLNKSDEAEALNMIEDGRLINIDNLEDIQKYCSRIAEWKNTIQEGSEMLLQVTEGNQIFMYLLHQEIRKRFFDIWTYLGGKGVIRVKKVSRSEKESLSSNKDEDIFLKKKIFDSILGFSRILKEIQNLKKPVTGHNVFLDLIMIYQQFYNPSGVSYKKFKRDIMDIFPNIYDTKCISFHLRNILSRENVWKSNVLSDLYHYLRDGKGATLVVFTPLVNHKTPNYVKEDHFHDAGFDSFCTGFCFLKMAHIFSLWDDEKKSFQLTPLQTSSAWLLGAVSSMKNQVNISRGQVNHVVLDGDDPKSTRPGLLYIQSKTNQPINISNVAELIAKYSAVDIQLLNKYNGLMAVANRKEAQEILNYFKSHKSYKVTKYSFFKHSELGKNILSGSVIALVLFAIFISKQFNKIRL